MIFTRSECVVETPVFRMWDLGFDSTGRNFVALVFVAGSSITPFVTYHVSSRVRGMMEKKPALGQPCETKTSLGLGNRGQDKDGNLQCILYTTCFPVALFARTFG